MGDVVEEANPDSTLNGREERGEDECPGIGLDPDVVERDVERRARPGEEPCDPAGDVSCSLAAVGQRLETDPRGFSHSSLRSRRR